MDPVVLVMIVIGLIIIGIVYITLTRKYNLAPLNGKKYLKVKEFGTEDIKRFCENAFIDYKWFYCTWDGWYTIANVDIGYVYENTLVGILKE
jgi:hypothetical protein